MDWRLVSRSQDVIIVLIGLRFPCVRGQVHIGGKLGFRNWVLGFIGFWGFVFRV